MGSLLSPFLKMGVTHALVQSWGTWPESSDFWKSTEVSRWSCCSQAECSHAKSYLVGTSLDTGHFGTSDISSMCSCLPDLEWFGGVTEMNQSNFSIWLTTWRKRVIACKNVCGTHLPFLNILHSNPDGFWRSLGAKSAWKLLKTSLFSVSGKVVTDRYSFSQKSCLHLSSESRNQLQKTNHMFQ